MRVRNRVRLRVRGRVRLRGRVHLDAALCDGGRQVGHLRREVGEPLEQSVPLGARLQPLGMELELELG